MMKQLLRIGLMCIALISYKTHAQNYPPDPSLNKIISDIKSDPNAKELMKSYGYNPAHINSGNYRLAKKSELKDYFYVKWYWRSDNAYKISLNKNYMDMRNFAIFLNTPKDENGVSHKIFFKVTYSRRTQQDFEDNKWTYQYLTLDPRENESYGLPSLTDEQRKEILLKYIAENKQLDEELKRKHGYLNKIVRVDSLLAPSDNIHYYKATGAGKYMWCLLVRCQYVNDFTEDGGVEETRMGYIRFPFEVAYKNGKYEVSNSLYSKDMWDSWAPGHKALYEAGLTKGKYFDPPVWMGTWYTEGLDAIMGKNVIKERPAGSKSFIEDRMKAIEAALSSIVDMDKAEIVATLKPFMDPRKADELANSYANLITDYKAKLCTLSVYRTQSGIPSAYEIGDLEGPKIEFGMRVDREQAKTKDLKKAYKTAGMSKATLNNNYGGLRNKSYQQTFQLKLINENWYITDAADTEECKVDF